MHDNQTLSEKMYEVLRLVFFFHSTTLCLTFFNTKTHSV